MQYKKNERGDTLIYRFGSWSLHKINVWCPNGEYHKATVTGEPCTFWSIPVRFTAHREGKSVTVSGYAWEDDFGNMNFTGQGKNADVCGSWTI